MKQEEVESVAKQMIEERVKAASKAMDRMTQIKEAYVDLRFQVVKDMRLDASFLLAELCPPEYGQAERNCC